MKKLLITGFDPFNGEKINPSYEAVKRIDKDIAGWEIYKKELPTEYEGSIENLFNLMEEIRPDLVILTGQAGSTTSIRLERVGINLRDSSLKDNSGRLCKGEKVFEEGHDAYFSNLDLDRIEEELKINNIPVVQSNSAGTFVCNNLLYGLLHKIRTENLDIGAGFVHLPYIVEQVIEKPNMASMELDRMVKALEIIIGVSTGETPS